MKRLLSIWTGALLALVAPWAAAQTQGVTADTITIGAYGPITGPASYIGLGGRDGMMMAVKEINAAGGINGRKINVVFEDDAHSPTRALAAVKKLVEQDKVFAIMSVAGSNATVGTIDYVREKGTVMYVSIASAPPVTWPHAKNMFRGGTTETARYGELYAEYLANTASNKRIAIMHGREEYPRNEAEATIAKMKAWFNVEPVARAEFNINDKDFTSQLVTVQKANPDVIAFFGNPAEAAIAMRQARELGIKQPFFVGSNMVDPSLIAVARTNAEGVTGFSLIPLLPGTNLPEMKTWEGNWKKDNPSAPAGRPNNFDLLAYGDMHVLAEGMRRAGKDLTTDSLIKGLESIRNYRIGPVATPRTFATNHHIGNLTLVPMQVKNGEWQPIAGWTSKRESDILSRYK